MKDGGLKMPQVAQEHDVVIVGAGFSGIALASMLKRSGFDRFVLIDRGEDFGGTWRDNTYPGAECDIQSHLYSFSFRPNPRWTKTYARQPEIQDYLTRVAQEEGLGPHAEFGHDVESAHWREGPRRWVLKTSRTTMSARLVVFATGHLSDPRVPNLPGLDRYRGRTFHSARWDHEHRLEGSRVAVVGTGASAIQVVPAIADRVASLTVFQRSAPYVIPRQDVTYTEAQKRMFERVPEAAQGFRDFLFWSNESRFPQRMMVPEFLREISETAAAHRIAQVEDAALLEKVTPDYTIGCKRILLSNDWYPALQKPGVELVTRAVSGFGENTVIDASGREHEVDCVIFCSGFEAAELPVAKRIHGEGGTRLDRAWSSGSEAFGGISVAGFPNLFFMNGPHVGLGAGSIIFMIETQAAYVADAIRAIDARGIERVEVRSDRQEAFLDLIGRRARDTVWTSGGCDSWYLDPRSGRLTTIWPDMMNRYRSDFGRFDADDYVLGRAR
ncbi:flavin-containing monooxygenase [Brevibacterium album]|uniref:flavin-containing monooxygenase n=1 Tax=Brevibacterium album TaxID=417948 RepID=UPI00042747C5|nr:NAD(P)/FAD-dependent oxidoreductase [Brevibacterium album]